MPHNIEKSATKRGKYVGYAKAGVYIISKYYGGWVAYAQDRSTTPAILYARSLADMSRVLAA